MHLLKRLAEDLYLPKPPFWLVALLVVSIPMTWVPLAFIAKARVTTSEARPINIFQGLDDQPRYNPQSTTIVFADGRAMRHSPEGTVARGSLVEDPRLEFGYAVDGNGEPITDTDAEGKTIARYLRGYPDSITVDEALLLRGRDRYNIYCAPCHGLSGYGDGMVNQRATQQAEVPSNGTAWVTASDLHATNIDTGQLNFGPEVYPEGKLFNTITHGIRNMKGYGAQIEPEDRWAIVAYIRALQLSQRAPASAVPASERGAISAAE